MALSLAMVALGAAVTAASFWIPAVEQWGPLFLLWTAGGAHLTWIVGHEAHEDREGRERR